MWGSHNFTMWHHTVNVIIGVSGCSRNIGDCNSVAILVMVLVATRNIAENCGHSGYE